MHVRRSLAAVCAVVPLACAAAGCSSNPVGTIAASNGAKAGERILNPVPGRCHTFSADGMNAVANRTAMDIWLHLGRDCSDPKGHPAIYLPTTFSATTVPGQARRGRLGRWRRIEGLARRGGLKAFNAKTRRRKERRRSWV